MNNLIIETLNPNVISDKDFNKICILEQDMWARNEGLGEYVKCHGCGKIHSKQDVFSNISKNIYIKTVSEIEQIIGMDSIKCNNCGGNTTHIFGNEEHRGNILSRYMDSESYISVMRNLNGDIVGFMDGYIDSFHVIYERELKHHYGVIGEEKLISYIEEIILTTLPDKFFSYSAIGTEEKYMNLYNIFRLLSSFFKLTPNCKINIGIMELNSGKILHALYNGIGIKGLNIQNKIQGINLKLKDGYNSDIFIQENCEKNADYFSGSFSSFLKSNRTAIKEILID